ncbi:DUF1415 domain-containing protein [Pleionea sp. CnH1-48]|uniref:DUF1415 domain-containing protein n=1 Tax=Pleionea sp. CnH1-48 TaxID=2954494 RepID=UPI002097EE83|nr:DUF1415 domain-containing protein [Pleionea sp. CnH1-48]MCO7223124.1 DUF1415 domain-containing protein [Pleionea sp. CnH1-48]
MTINPSQIISETQHWLMSVVVDLNFCPFARPEVENDRIRYQVDTHSSMADQLNSLQQEFELLDKQTSIETTLLIYPEHFFLFHEFWAFVERCEQWLEQHEYEGTYQLAHFHPEYVFADSDEQDAANYTNRSPYPMIHILREASIENVLQGVKSPEKIPQRNITHARRLGREQMAELLKACYKKSP